MKSNNNNNSRMVSASWKENQNSAMHTSGPWKVNGIEVTCGLRVIATTAIDGAISIGRNECEANVHLIAAAPDLLEALIDVKRAIEIQQNSPDVRVQLDTTLIEAVIAKATGVTNPCPTCGGEGNCPDCDILTGGN